MFNVIRNATRWVGHHSLPAAAATVVVLGAAGGGVGYTIAGQHTTTAAISSGTPSTTAPTAPAPSSAAGKAGSAAGRGQALINRALRKLSTQINVPVATLRTELKTESIDQVVTAAGKDPSVVEQDILTQLKARADKAVAAKKITAAQEQAFLDKAKTEVDKLLADQPAQRAADLKTLLQNLRAHHVPGTAPKAAG